MRVFFTATFSVIATLLSLASTSLAQDLFTPIVRIDGRVITVFERDQRALMLEVFRTPGDLQEQALEALINDRLQLEEAERRGIEVTREEVLDGMSEFAGRANLSREEFVGELAKAGVDVETFEDFVEAGVAWRKVVREQFAGSILISEGEIDRAIRREPRAGLRVLLSEIILPADTPERAARSEELAPELARITTLTGFASAAREFSASTSRGRGGRLDWLPLNNLPPALRPVVQALSVGEVTPPVPIPNGIALFQLRALEETPPDVEVTALDYAAFYLPGGRSAAALRQAAIIESEIDTCDDLYGLARGLPDGRLQRDTLPPADVPGDVALELAKLDINEVSTELTRANGQTLVFLMLCDRSYRDAESEPNRNAVGRALTEQRAAAGARNLLAELRANAEIVFE